MLETYQKKILPNPPPVELIHASAEDVEADALRRARQAGFTWPTILFRNWAAVGLNEYGAFAGNIYLVDSAGNLIAQSEKDAFEKITSLK